MEYKDTIFLPKSTFEMRANLPTKEPKILDEWDKEKIFYKLREKSKVEKNLFFMMDLHMQMDIYIWEQH